MDSHRRRFLRTSGALSAAALFPSLAALTPLARAQAASDYRAIVCVFLYGGNDGSNMVVPYDDYAQYAAGRGNGGAGLGKSELLPIAPKGLAKYGLHPNLQPLVPLFEQGKLAVVCNAGPLLQPLTRADYLGSKPRPRNLFSHSDQQQTWQGLIPGAATNSGWGGRIVDVTKAGNADLAIPGMVSMSGDALYTVGVTSLPVSLSGNGSLGLSGDRSSVEGKARYDAMNRILRTDRDNTLVAKASDVMALAIQSSDALTAALDQANTTVDTAFQGSNGGLSDQLYQVAKLIASRTPLGVQRQGFFVSMGGFDTHNEQRGGHGQLMDELGRGLGAFAKAMDALGVSDKVTTFTMSDFGRTFRVNANAGTDHAWGNHQFVLGGGVKGGAFYGAFPNLTMGGPDDAGSDGQWIPTTSIDQFGATIAKWFGVAPTNLGSVFPNLGSFPVADLGFLA